MPRKKSVNDTQIALRIPSSWLKWADELTASMTPPGMTVDRTAILRASLFRGLKLFRDEHSGKKGRDQ